MSNAILPVLKGLKWDVVKAPGFSTRILTSVNGKELRSAHYTAPIYTFRLSYGFLRDNAVQNELKQLMGFFLARQGKFDNFLYPDPTDNSVSAQNFGTGTGAQTAYQLVRAYGGFSEPVMNINGAASIYVGGVLKTLTTDYTINSLGLVTFVLAPANGAALTWTGAYYFRARFNMDMAEFGNMMANLWELKKLEMIASLGNKV